MKIYVKAATSNALIQAIKQHKGTDIIQSGIRIHLCFVGSYGGKYNGNIPDNIIVDFVNKVFDCINTNISIDRNLFKFKLVIYASDDSRDKSIGGLSAWLKSDYMSGSHVRTPYGGHIEDYPSIHISSYSSYELTSDNLDNFSQEVRDYCVDLNKISNKSTRLLDKYPDITDNIIKAAHEFSHWIVKEHQSTREAVAERTINNPKSYCYQKEWKKNELDLLFDYAEEHNYSYDDLKALCRDSTFLATRLKSLGA